MLRGPWPLAPLAAGRAQSRERRRRTTLVPLAVGACCLALLASGLGARGASPRAYTVPTSFGTSPGYTLKESDVLGAGAYGSVYKCKDSKGNDRAVKVIPMWRMQNDNDRDVQRAKIQAEIEAYQHIGKHPNIVPLLDDIEIAMEGDSSAWPRWKFVVMEIANGGELADLIKEQGKFAEPKAKHIFKQLVAALGHVHGRNVIHRDMKTDNVLICTDSSHSADKPVVKLIDFGACHWAKEGPVESNVCIGTLETMAPEVILARGDDFDASDPEQVEAVHEVEFRTRPFGIRKYAPGPGGIGARVLETINQERYPKDPLGQAWKKGVKPGWVVKSVGGRDVTQMAFNDIIDLMGDRLLDNSSRGAFDGSFAVTGDNRGKGKVLPKVEMVALPTTVEYAEIKRRPYGVKADVWSLGVVLYTMVTGEPPFPAEEPAVLAAAFAPVKGASAELADLISKMLVADASERSSLDAVAAHPWLA